MRLRVAPVVLARQLDDQRADFLFRLGPAAWRRLPPGLLARLPNPAPQRDRVHDRHQLAETSAELGSELDQPVLFLLGHWHAMGQLRSQDLVLDLQVPDVASQLFLRRTGNQKQQTVVEILHRDKISKVLVSGWLASILHPAARFQKPFAVLVRRFVKTAVGCSARASC